MHMTVDIISPQSLREKLRLDTIAIVDARPFTSFFSKTGNFIDQQTYLQQLPETLSRAGMPVTYCEVSVRSALFALLHEIYTGRVVANYDGSILEWALDPELPMERDSRSQYRPLGAIHSLLRRF